MTIEKDESGNPALTCDICGATENEIFYEFRDAVDYKKQNGWKSQKTSGEWEDVCPGCQEVG